MSAPSAYSQDIADRICNELIEGRSLRSICKAADMPAASTVCRWLGENQAFQEQYARAREAQADTLADEMLDIADDGTNDWVARQRGEETVTEIDHDHITRSRLRVDTRKWIASKLKPKKYGERLTQELVGKDGAPLLPASFRMTFPPVAPGDPIGATPAADESDTD